MTLPPLARSLAIALLAIAATVNLACSLPQVKPRMAADFAAGSTRLNGVALLPVDLAVHVKGTEGVSKPDAELAEDLTLRLSQSIATGLRARGYKVRAIGRGGQVQGGAMVIQPTDLAAMRVEIHRATSFLAEGPGVIETRVSADLGRQLQAATGLDGALYARGWVYVDQGESAGATAAKIIGATLMVLFVVGVVLMLLAGTSKGSKGSKGKHRASRSSRHRSRSSSWTRAGRGHRSRARRHRTARGGRAALATARAFAGATRAMVQAAADVGEIVLMTAPPPPPDGPPPRPPWHGPQERSAPPCLRCPAPAHEAQGSAAAASAHASGPPQALPAPPAIQRLQLRQVGKGPSGSQVGLAMSLVHNRSGRVLWHARQIFPVKVRPGYDVQDLVSRFLDKLPLAASAAR